MKLIPQWRRCYRLYSVQLGLFIAVFGFVQANLLPLWQAELSPNAYAVANSVLAALLFLVRLIRQGPDQEIV